MAREPWELELDQLREQYQRELPEKLRALGALLEAARGARDGRSLEAAHREAHSLKGSAGSYGFAAASSELQGIEDALGLLLEGEPAGIVDAWPGLEAALARARASLPAA